MKTAKLNYWFADRRADRKLNDRKMKSFTPVSILHLLVLHFSVAILLSIACPNAAAAESNPGDPLNGTWRVALDGIFEPAGKKNGGARRTLPIYVISREGKFLYGLGSAPDWNQTTYPADVSALRYDATSGKLTGTMQVKLNPDPWIPRDHKPIVCSVEVDATLDRANPTNKAALTGTYRAKLGAEPVEGAVSGYVYTQPLVDLARCQLALSLNHALLGGREPYHNRIAVRLDIADGRAVAAQFGMVGLNNQPYDFRPFNKFNITTTRDGFSGELTIPYEVLGAVGDAAAEYAIKLDGRRINNLCGGEFTVQVAHAGKTSTHEGNFKGSINPPVARDVSFWDAELKSDRPWFVPVKDFKPLAPGEHPRLFFRKSDLPEIKRRAATPEGQEIVARLKATLGGGEEMPKHFSKATKAYDNLKERLPEGAYTVSHAAGFGMLYQLTGDTKYAGLARECFERGLAGQRDRDDRYSFRAPGGQLRAGPSLGMYALAYDLAYDGWPEDFRRKAALELQNWNDDLSGEWAKAEKNSLKAICLTPHQMPACNHWGSQLGAGLVVLALLGDPGTDDVFLKSCLAAVEKNMVRGVTAGYGDGGFYSEGPGPAHMMSNPGLVPLVQAMKVALGKDYLTPRPNLSWITLHWVMELLPDAKGQPVYPCRKPSSYGNERLLDGNGGMSHGGWFSQGFGAIPDETKPALLWLYNHYVAAADQNRRDTLNYPHRAILALVNWPIGVPEKNPADVLGRTSVDRLHGWYVFRNGWSGADDVVVSAWLGSGPKGNISLGGPDLLVWGMGERIRLAALPPCQTSFYKAEKDGSGVVSGVGVSIAVDFSGKSGAPVLVAVASEKDMGKFSDKPAGTVSRVREVRVGPANFRVLTMGRAELPTVQASGNAVKIGARTFAFENNTIVMR
jgi:hypothetical protein